jgi:hypothetical protein
MRFLLVMASLLFISNAFCSSRDELKKMNKINFEYPLVMDSCDEGEGKAKDLINESAQKLSFQKIEVEEHFSVKSELKLIENPKLFFNEFKCDIAIEIHSSLFSFLGYENWTNLKKSNKKNNKKTIKLSRSIEKEVSLVEGVLLNVPTRMVPLQKTILMKN